MSDCEYVLKCPFFNDKMKGMPSMANVYKKRYCQTDRSQCARYIVRHALGPEAMPDDLFPNNVARAEAILAESVEKDKNEL